MLAAFTQSGIASEEYLDAQEFTQISIDRTKCLSIQDVLNICNQFSWRIIANNTIDDAKEGSWITDKYYSESIRNVIDKAIADCITERNEFACKAANATIIFDADPRMNKYTEANWNAVILWDLVHICHCEYLVNGKCNITQAYNEVAARVKNRYATIDNIDGIVNKAINDIKEYAKEMDLDTWIIKFCEISCDVADISREGVFTLSYKGYNNEIAPGLFCEHWHNSNESKNGSEINIGQYVHCTKSLKYFLCHFKQA